VVLKRTKYYDGALIIFVWRLRRYMTDVEALDPVAGREGSLE
jgi:hypothetical protein